MLVLAAFAPVLGNDFVNWDDEVNFLKNPHYRGLGWPQVRWAFSTFLLGVYQPVAWLLLGAQSVVWGLAPRGYHLTSLVLHAANAVALVRPGLGPAGPLPARGVPPGPVGAGGGGGVGDGAVRGAPAAGRGGGLGVVPAVPALRLFAMLAVLAYLRAAAGGPPRWGWLAGSFGLFVAAMLSKAAAVSLPAVLVILDVYPLRRLGGGPGRWFGPCGAEGLAGEGAVRGGGAGADLGGRRGQGGGADADPAGGRRAWPRGSPRRATGLVLPGQDGDAAGHRGVLPAARADRLAGAAVPAEHRWRRWR